MSAYITKRELAAVLVAWDELVAYIDTVGDEGALDDEEMPTGQLRDVELDLRYLLARNGLLDVSVTPPTVTP